MAKIQVGTYPHIHSGNTTRRYMMDLPITIFPLAIVAIIFQYLFVTIKLGASYTEGIQVAIQAALVIFTGVFSCIIAETLWTRYVDKKYNDFAGWFRTISVSYPAITGLLYVLSLPVGTPLYVVAIGGFVAIIIGKSIFGGIGQNIFNPALVGRAFVTIAYGSLLGEAVVYTKYGQDAIASATPLVKAAQEGALLSYDSFKAIYGSIWDLVLGLYPTALGEGLSLLIIIAFIYLSIRKTINWFVPVIYVGLVFFMTWAVALINNLGTGTGLGTLAIYFPLFHVLTGGLLLGAVFMATEPVTSPITKRGRALFAVYLAVITFAIRILANAPEGVLYSILFMNLFVPIIDRFYYGQFRGVKRKEYALWIVTALVVIGITLYAAFRVGGVA